MVPIIDIKSRLTEHAQLLIEASLAATGKWKKLLTDDAELAAPLGPSERANFLHAHFRLELTRRFSGHEDVHPSTRPGFFILVFGGDLILRPKYCGRGAPTNVQTDSQTLLASQMYKPEIMEALAFEGILDPPTLITMGYTLSGPDLARLFVLRECRGWAPSSFDLYGGTAVAEQLVLPGMPEPQPARVSSARPAAERQVERE
jgi:hypothetical protein